MMPLKTFDQQVLEHIAFLRGNGLEVSELALDAGFVRCRAIGDLATSRGEYSYKTDKNKMGKPGLVGLVTWCRGLGGQQSKHSTYGQDGEIESRQFERPLINNPVTKKSCPNEDIKSKCRYLWDQAKETGRSDYLERKGVGAYGIRFQENDYGRVALIPARDPKRHLHALQFLNGDGSKRFLKGSSWLGLFHKLREPVNGQLIGIAESYVTAATCFELSGVCTVCAFNSGNLPAVAKSLREMYPDSQLIIFADNDRHLEAKGLPNQGVLKAQEAKKIDQDRIVLSIPQFVDCEASKEASDWNDLIRLKGRDHAQAQIVGSICHLFPKK